jgi:hypothetical protein
MFSLYYNALILLAMTRAFQRYPICRGALDQSGSGSGHATTWAWATLQVAIYELQYVLQYIVINKLFRNHQLILVFLFLFSVALAHLRIPSSLHYDEEGRIGSRVSLGT